MISIQEAVLSGVYVVSPIHHVDARGCFVKTYHPDILSAINWNFRLQEEFYSVSARNVLRGMHFQAPPHSHQKIVTCISGRVLDVLLDLRPDSASFGQHLTIHLDAISPKVLFIPIGIAHGFLSLENNSTLMYKTDCVHAAQFDLGVAWNSFRCDWPIEPDFIVMSERDASLPQLSELESPF